MFSMYYYVENREENKKKSTWIANKLQMYMKERINSINFFGILYLYALPCSFGRHFFKWEYDITFILNWIRNEWREKSISYRSSFIRQIEKVYYSMFIVHCSLLIAHCSLLAFEINIFIFFCFVLNCKACDSRKPRAPLEMMKLIRIVKCVQGTEYSYCNYCYYYLCVCWVVGGGEKSHFNSKWLMVGSWVGRTNVQFIQSKKINTENGYHSKCT